MSFRAFDNPIEHDEDDERDAEAFFAGDRLCAPAATERGSTMLSSLVVIAFLSGVVWLFMSYPAAWQAIVSATTTSRDAQQVAAPLPDAAPIGPPLETRSVAAAPGAEAGVAQPPPPAEAAEQSKDSQPIDAAPQANAEPSAAKANSEPSAAPLATPKADPSDPNQTRALAVGLHPDLSGALLARLSDADFRNAKLAIQTALAETPDGDVFSWPREAKGKGAQFEVAFVAGTSADCRRYVVIVTKDHWSTTAPPMETCGSALPKRKTARTAG
ncbi:MAG: hypothetical protein WBP38_03530 [Hyphomicrobium sp.]|jgi:surface antigen|nr:hypothetical protein [Hyphomicrobium sp.]